ncbi:hypothetical protein P886_1781 [Alteromonadaceae bacterium 2753L.S.0a.02]|nr:hypothetical protein P886_1781 [Alteromonadaceae bacterium 2753L.S.0a.02]
MRNFLVILVFTIAAAVAWVTWRTDTNEPVISVAPGVAAPAVEIEAPPQAPTLSLYAAGSGPAAPSKQNAGPGPEPALSPFAEALRRWRENIASSDNPVDQIVNAVLEQDSARQEELLYNALLLDPYNTLLNYTVLEHCLENSSSTLCGPEYLDMLQQVDGDNAVIQDFKALDAYRNGDYQTALRELAQANNARLTDMYRWQRLNMIADSLTRQGMPKDGEFFAEVLKDSRMHGGPRMAAMYQMCQDQRSDPNWQGTCLGRGLTMSRNAASAVSQDFGYGLAMSIVDDPNKLHNEIALEHQQRRNTYSGLQREMERVIADPQWRISDQQWQQFIEIYSQQGEQAALSYLLQSGGH